MTRFLLNCATGMVMTKSYNVIIQNAAQNDLYAIWEYIAGELKNPNVAAHMLDKLHKSILSLRELPERHALLTDKLLRSKGIRKILVENYIVFYRVNEEEKSVAVLRILHVRRDWEHIL